MATTSRGPKDYDVALGKRLKAVRMAAGIGQMELGKAIGVTFQQIQKYESGANRVAVSTLLPMARALGVSLDQLLPGQMDDGAPLPDPFSGLGATIGGVELARLYTRMDATARKSLLNVAQTIVAARAGAQAAAG